MSDNIIIDRDLSYAQHGGVSLPAILWRPASAGPHPVMVAIPGGAWRQGGPEKFKAWGEWLAARGWAVMGIGYRLATPTKGCWPECFLDARAAVQFLRANAARFNLDPARVSAFGDSAGGHLASLIGLAGDQEPFRSACPDDPFRHEPTTVRCVVGLYGVYDLITQWEHDQLYRPTENIVAVMAGCHLYEDRKTYFEASPISYAVKRGSGPSFLLVHGDEDDVVDRNQSDDFHRAVRLAGFYSRKLIVPGAGHYFVTDPADEPNSTLAWLRPRVLRFLNERG